MKQRIWNCNPFFEINIFEEIVFTEVRLQGMMLRYRSQLV
jgi:hypothetical protein